MTGPARSSEDDLIARHFRPLATDPAALALVDDCAEFTPPPGHDLVLKADAVAAGIHFFPEDDWNAVAREREARDKARRALVEKLAAEKLSDVTWRQLVEQAKGAAERGDKDFLLIRFPAALCDDGGRMINAPDPNWPTSLRGPAADVYERWRDELKPAGFGLVARILEFPGGYPGDAGIILTWGA